MAARWPAEGQDGFARLIHRLDLVLEPGRGNHRSQFAGGINHYCYLGPARHGFAVNAGDISGRLCALLANADLGCVASHTLVANVDVVTACIEVDAGICAHEDVVTAGGETESGIRAHRNIG